MEHSKMKAKKVKVNLIEEKPYQFSKAEVEAAIIKLNSGGKVDVKTIIKMLFQLKMLIIHHGVFVFDIKSEAERMMRTIGGQKKICEIIEGRAKCDKV